MGPQGPRFYKRKSKGESSTYFEGTFEPSHSGSESENRVGRGSGNRTRDIKGY